MARIATGIDIGTSTVKLIRGEVKGTTFIVSEFFVGPNADGTLEGGWAALGRHRKSPACRIGLTGRDVNVRYTRVPRLPDWQLRKLMRFEAEEIGDQSESTLASDFNVLPEIPEIEGEDVVLLSMARESLLEEHVRGLASMGGKLDAFSPNAIGLYNAFLQYGVVQDDTVLVANLGHENLDVILMRGTDLLFARNMSGGSKLFDQAIAQRFSIDEERAERYKREFGTLEVDGKFVDPNQEKAARALTGPAGQILSLLQSAVLFAKSQVKLSTLKLDRVFLCGGGAALPGMPRFLKEALEVPVEIFDPFVVVDTSKLDAESAQLLEEHKLEAVTALGLASSASDPEAYSIEILPHAIRKRRDFMSGPAYLIACAILAVIFLCLFGWRESTDLTRLESEARRIEAQFRGADSKHRQASTLVEENQELDEFGQELFALSGAGESMIRALDVLERRLPEDFWLESLNMAMGFDEELGVPRSEERPILRLKGRAREGTDSATALWEEFIAGIRADFPQARLKERMGERHFVLDVTTVARVEVVPEAAEPPEVTATEEQGR